MRVLAGDIGGTKTLMQIAKVKGASCKTLLSREFRSADYAEFPALFAEFVAMAKADGLWPVESACLGVAGPVERRTAKITNLAWTVDARALALTHHLPELLLINDFQAIGYGIEGLAPESFVTLQQGQEEPYGMRVLIGAGTGLGEGVMVWVRNHYSVFPTEGGHVDFAPRDELQMELWRALRQELPRVTCEHVVSGPGLVRIYRFLAARHPAQADPALLQAMQERDPAAAIAEFAQQRGDALASQALDVFVQAYGAQAGNLALTSLPFGGVFIAGGIAPKLIDKLADGQFMQAFRAKHPMTELMARFPVKVIMEPRTGLIGAALRAGRDMPRVP